MQQQAGSGTRVRPRGVRARIQLGAAGLLVVLGFAGAAAVQVHGAVNIEGALADGGSYEDPGISTATATTVVPAPAPEPETFTIGDLAAGRVSQEAQDRFWQEQLDAIVAAPCPTAPGPGGTTVTLFVGADEAWTARLRDAAAAHAEACAA